MAVASTYAFTVTFNGKPVDNGGTVTVGADAFTLVEKVPGKVYSMDAKAEVLVSGADGIVSMTATSKTGKIQLCGLGSSCYSFYKENDSDPLYIMNIPNIGAGLEAHLSFNKVTEVPKEINDANITLTDSKGTQFKFTFVYDTESEAGIENVAADATLGYTVYTLTGVKILETADKSQVVNLPAGLYIINGKKVIIK